MHRGRVDHMQAHRQPAGRPVSVEWGSSVRMRGYCYNRVRRAKSMLERDHFGGAQSCRFPCCYNCTGSTTAQLRHHPKSFHMVARLDLILINHKVEFDLTFSRASTSETFLNIWSTFVFARATPPEYFPVFQSPSCWINLPGRESTGKNQRECIT